MSRRYQSTESVINGLIASMLKDGSYSPKTIAHTSEHCRLVARYIQDLYAMTPQDLRAIHQQMAAEGLAVSTQKSYIHAIRQLLKFVGNPTYQTKVLFQADTRPKVDWLTQEEASTVLSATLPNIQRIAVVLSLCMGLRRVEIVRLRMSDIDLPKKCITVTGKGRAGGKLRLVPFHSRFLPTLEDWLVDRSQIVAKSRTYPDNVLIWYDREHHIAKPYNAVKGSGIDGVIRRSSQTVGIHYSAHTLRRTFGRLLWLAGVPVVTIAKILGHSSTEQTLSYIGANLDDMATAIKQLTL